MMITESSKKVIPFGPQDAKRVGEGSFYLDLIVWLNGDRIELGERVGFNYGCYVNGYGGLRIGDGTIVGPYAMIHTANHQISPGGQSPTRIGLRSRSRSALTAGSGWASASSLARASGTGASSEVGASSPVSSRRTASLSATLPVRSSAADAHPLPAAAALRSRAQVRRRAALGVPRNPARLRLPRQDVERLVRLG